MKDRYRDYTILPAGPLLSRLEDYEAAERAKKFDMNFGLALEPQGTLNKLFLVAEILETDPKDAGLGEINHRRLL